MLIPPGEQHGEEIFAVIDGVILAGGGDVDPALYGGRKHETIYSVDAERDKTELSLVHHLVQFARSHAGHLPRTPGD